MRHGSRLGGVLLGIVSAASFLMEAAAQPPDLHSRYRFVPWRSKVEATGGFAGIQQDYFVFGKFGLLRGYEDFGTRLEPYAKFENVESWLVPNGPLTYILDTDRTLNLTGLDGTFRDPQLLHFQGEDGQGQPIKLQAAIRGRLLHLTGENDPGCCDFFHYKVDAWALRGPYADFNFDGRVDRIDMERVKANFGMLSGATLEQGDADGDGDVDGDDFLHWQVQFGEVAEAAMFAEGASVFSAAVPEPAGAMMLGWAAVVFAVFFTRRRRGQASG